MSRDLTILVLFVFAMALLGTAVVALLPVRIGDHYIMVVGTPWWLTVANVGVFVLVVLAARRHVRRVHS
jgi:hypothetical protein